MRRICIASCLALVCFVGLLVAAEVHASTRPLALDVKAGASNSAAGSKDAKSSAVAAASGAAKPVTEASVTTAAGASKDNNKAAQPAATAKPADAVAAKAQGAAVAKPAEVAKAVDAAAIPMKKNPDAEVVDDEDDEELESESNTSSSTSSSSASTSSTTTSSAVRTPARSPPPPSLGHECKACLAWRATTAQKGGFAMGPQVCSKVQDVMSSSILLHLATMGRIAENFTEDTSLCEAKSASVCGTLYYNDEQDATLYVAWLEALLGRLFGMSCNDTPALFDISLESSPADPGMCPQLYSSRYCQPALGTAKA